MNRLNSIEYLTEFIMGAILGFGLTSVILVIYNLFCVWRGCAPMGLAWWNAIPLPLLLGICMAKIIASLKLGDY